MRILSSRVRQSSLLQLSEQGDSGQGGAGEGACPAAERHRKTRLYVFTKIAKMVVCEDEGAPGRNAANTYTLIPSVINFLQSPPATSCVDAALGLHELTGVPEHLTALTAGRRLPGSVLTLVL